DELVLFVLFVSGLRLRDRRDRDSIAVGMKIEAPLSSARQEAHIRPEPRLVRDERLAVDPVRRDHDPLIRRRRLVQQFLPSPRPRRKRTAAGGDDILAAGSRKWSDVDFHTPRTIGNVREPFAIRRKRRRVGGAWTSWKGARLPGLPS